MNEKTYRVTASREIQMLDNAGNTVTLNRVWITTDRGATGSVDVEKKNWEKARLEKILANKATELDLAFTLTEE